MIKPKKEFILWLSNGAGAYSPNEYDSFAECLIADKYSADWYVTKSINDISAYASYQAPKQAKP